jgi:hypothetical protein
VWMGFYNDFASVEVRLSLICNIFPVSLPLINFRNRLLHMKTNDIQINIQNILNKFSINLTCHKSLPFLYTHLFSWSQGFFLFEGVFARQDLDFW